MATYINNIDFRGFSQSYDRDNKTGSITNVGTQTDNVWGFRRLTRTSNTTPNFMRDRKKRKKQRLYLPMNPFSFTLHRKSGLKGPKEVRTIDFFGDKSAITIGDIHDNIDNLQIVEPTLAEKVHLADICKTKCLLDMKDQKVNLVQVYAERHQTVNLFTNTVVRVTDCVTNLRKGNLVGAGRSLGISVSDRRHRKYVKKFHKDPDSAVSHGWLELQYGWRPLLQDIYGSAELIAQHQLREIRSRTSVRASKEVHGVTEVENNPFSKSYSNWKYKYTVKMVVYYSTPGESIKTLSQVGITNPAHIAWELTPWSFVVDWFLPIGNWIQSWDATLGLVFEKGCQTNFHRFEQENFGRGGTVSSGGATVIETWNRKSNREYIKCDRFVLTDFPRIALPRFKNPFSKEHLANLTALLHQLFKR